MTPYLQGYRGRFDTILTRILRERFDSARIERERSDIIYARIHVERSDIILAGYRGRDLTSNL